MHIHNQIRYVLTEGVTPPNKLVPRPRGRLGERPSEQPCAQVVEFDLHREVKSLPFRRCSLRTSIGASVTSHTTRRLPRAAVAAESEQL